MGCGDGVIRDAEGYFIHTFSNFYGPGTNMIAEIFGLKDWLLLCQTLVLDSVEVETDSLVSVLVLNKNYSYPWCYEYELRQYRSSLKAFELSHVYREQK